MSDIDGINPGKDARFEAIASDLYEKGYSIQSAVIPDILIEALRETLESFTSSDLKPAGIGRGLGFSKNEQVRSDSIRWVDDSFKAGVEWLSWSEALKDYLNRRLYLGLFSYESHFSCFNAGDFYKTHVDAFKGEANRVLSTVLYLNKDWDSQDGGELVLYMGENDSEGIKVLPKAGTFVCFLSEEFPHEVLPAKRTRHSIAGWFRQNTSSDHKIDPPN